MGTLKSSENNCKDYAGSSGSIIAVAAIVVRDQKCYSHPHELVFTEVHAKASP